jgi:hypothetical protein
VGLRNGLPRAPPDTHMHRRIHTHTRSSATTASRGTPQNVGGRIARRALKARPAHEFTATLGEIYTRVGLKTDTEVQTLTRLLHPLHRLPVALRLPHLDSSSLASSRRPSVRTRCVQGRKAQKHTGGRWRAPEADAPVAGPGPASAIQRMPPSRYPSFHSH